MALSPKYRITRCLSIDMYHVVFKGLLALLFGLFIVVNAVGQPLNPELRIAVREDNEAVHIYHTAMPAIGHGFNIFRKTEDQDEFQQINLDPIRGVTSGTEFRAYLGTLYDDIERITDQSSANETLAKVRSDIRTANLLSFTYPQMAQALGRLFIDSEAPTNQFVTYRIEFVDALDKPTGIAIEKSLILLPEKPLPPTYLRAENQDNRVTLFWQYPVLNENSDDKVIQFIVYRIDPNTNEHQQVNDRVILKNDALFEYAYSYNLTTTGQTEQYYVRAIDISGQQSDPSETLHFETIDQTPPSAIATIQAEVLPGSRVQVSWQVSTKNDVAGFNLYRSSSLTENESYIRLNTDLLSPVSTTFNDTLITDTSNKIFYYRVSALDAQGNEGPMSTAALVLLKDRTPPSPPSNLSASYIDGLVELSWGQPDASDDFASFIVLRHVVDKDAAKVPTRVNPDNLTETSLIDTGIAQAGFVEGARYLYEVLSIDSAGNQSVAATAELHIPDVTPPAPPNGIQVSVDQSSRIAVFWNPSASSDVMSYLIYRRKTGSPNVQVMSLQHEGLRFYDLTAEKGSSYEYWITAADYAGNESLPSETSTIIYQDQNAPRHVRNVQAEIIQDSNAIIRWEPVPSSDLAGYKVYKSASMTGLFEPMFNEVITTTRWTDENADDNAWYKVYAIDTSGNMSPPSNPVRVFTPLSTNK